MEVWSFAPPPESPGSSLPFSPSGRDQRMTHTPSPMPGIISPYQDPQYGDRPSYHHSMTQLDEREQLNRERLASKRRETAGGRRELMRKGSPAPRTSSSSARRNSPVSKGSSRVQQEEQVLAREQDAIMTDAYSYGDRPMMKVEHHGTENEDGGAPIVQTTSQGSSGSGMRDGRAFYTNRGQFGGGRDAVGDEGWS